MSARVNRMLLWSPATSAAVVGGRMLLILDANVVNGQGSPEEEKKKVVTMTTIESTGRNSLDVWSRCYGV